MHYLIKNESPTKVCFSPNWICNNIRQKRMRSLLWFQGLFAFCFLQWLCASYLVLYLQWLMFMPDLDSILADLMPAFHSYVSGIQCLLCNMPWYAGNSLLWFSWLFFNGMCESFGHWPSMWITLINAHYILSHMFPLHFSSCITEMSSASQSDLGLFSCLSAGLVECNCPNHCLVI